MPIPGGGRYRVVTTKSGKKVRLHFGKGGQVNEAKNLKTGATHTPQEFAEDRKKRRKLPKRGSGELTPLGSRTLAGYMDKWGDSEGKTKFHAAMDRGLISRTKMMKGKD